MTRRLVSLLLSAGGLVLLIWIVERIGIDAVLSGLASVGRGLPIILLLSFARHALRAYAWTTLIDAPVPLGAAIAATISGDSWGNITPLGPIASEPAKSAYLSTRAPVSATLPALAAENFIYGISMAIYVALGGLALVAASAASEAMRTTGLISLAAMAVLLAGAALVAWRRPAGASALLARLPHAWTGRHVDRVQRFETHTYDLVRRGLRPLVAAETTFHILSFVETWFTLRLLTGTSMPIAALVLDSVNRIVNVAFKLIPLRAGVDEYAAALVSGGVGLRPDTGIVLALIRKIRLLIWAAVGLGLWTRR